MKEKLDNYLIGKGCSIASNYAYIYDTDKYDYKKEEKEKKVEITDISVPLNKEIKNTVKFNQTLFFSNYFFATHMSDVIKSKDIDEVYELCDYANTAALVYFTDYVKYVVNKFPITDDIFNNLISLVDASSDSLKDKIDKILTKNQFDNLNAVNTANAERASFDARTIADAANASRTTYSKEFSKPGLISGVNTYGYGVSYSSLSQSDLDASFAASWSIANDTLEREKRWANESALEDLFGTLSKTITKFNDSIREIVIYKMPKLFNEDVCNNEKDISKNPAYLDKYAELFSKFDEKDNKNFLEVCEYYNFDLSGEVEKYLSNEIVSYYKEKQKCDYDSPIVKLYYEVADKKDLVIPSAESSLKKYFEQLISKKKVKVKEKYVEETRLIDDCKYLSDKDKEELKKLMSSNHGEAKWKLKGRIFGIIVVILLIAGFFGLHFLTKFLQSNEDPNIIFLGNIVGAIRYIYLAVILYGFYFAWKSGRE